jgi:hypothetical protein
MLPGFLLFARPDSPDVFLHRLAAAVHAGRDAEVRSLFARSQDSDYLFEMAKGKGGLRVLKVGMLPTPPGWVGYGRYWVVFHTYQDLEDHHDPVYTVDDGGHGLRLGREVKESDVAGQRIRKIAYRAVLEPATSRASVRATVDLATGGTRRAPVFRLNDFYTFSPGRAITADETRVAPVRPDRLVRVGSLVIPWTAAPKAQYVFDYSAKMAGDHEDRVTAKAAYLTSWWLPSIGRLPHPVDATVDAPRRWVVRAEGEPGAVQTVGDRKVSRFRCDLPISYPKIVAGNYVKAAEKVLGNETFRIYQLPPVSKATATRDLDQMLKAAAFYRTTLGPLPFRGYECYDSDTYYGIESYSHTILKKGITTWAIPHEMGHSYFGGLAPCPYVEDSWNESLTQYIDSVVRSNDADHTLELGLQTVTVPVPLSHMPVAWSYNNTTYTRGAYAMRMLEDEIGRPNVLAALKKIAFDRVGKDTRWADLRPYFERAGGISLDWFWSQWIENARFPALSFTQSGNVVTVRQSGTPAPYRLRFALVAGTKRKVVTLDKPEVTFTLETDASARLEIFPYTLAKVAER